MGVTEEYVEKYLRENCIFFANIREMMVNYVLTMGCSFVNLRMDKLIYGSRIVSGIGPESFYQITVNYLTTRESVPRVPACVMQVLVQVVQAFLCYTEGTKTQAGRFRSKKPSPFGFFTSTGGDKKKIQSFSTRSSNTKS